MSRQHPGGGIFLTDDAGEKVIGAKSPDGSESSIIAKYNPFAALPSPFVTGDGVLQHGNKLVLVHNKEATEVATYKQQSVNRMVCDWSPSLGTLSAINGTFALDSTVTIQGKPAIKATGSATTPFTGTLTFTNPISFATFKNITIPVIITCNETASGIAANSIKFVLTTSTGKTISLTVHHTQDMTPGVPYEFNWNRDYDYNNANFFNYTGGATVATLDSESITSIALTFTTGASSASYPIWLGPVKLDCAPADQKGRIYLRVDGPYATHMNVLDVLNKYGVNAIFGLRKQLVGSELTESQMNTIYEAGNDWWHHTFASNKTGGYVNATDWPTAFDIINDHLNQWAYMASMGWTRGIGFSVRAFTDLFPSSVGMARQFLVRDALLASGIKLMSGSQTVVGRKIPIGYGPIAGLPILKYAISTSDSTTLQNLIDVADIAATTKTGQTILMHGAGGAPGNQGLSVSVLDQFIARVKARSDVEIVKLTDDAYKYYL
ncbi:hypothetical protein [Methylomonas koyamae]|uniref:hypothetical protein n=1 Tax=Methylomonas koyamae TaxID=702114 RepID=UPI00112CD98D|nr:hypothetical protein [Methylomonas koyamae]TPQ24934.1 hypothetical protein C2U68_17300 [Methylomonas koyamae]